MAEAVGGSHGAKQLINAAKVPVPVELLVNTKVRHPPPLRVFCTFSKLAETMPGGVLPVKTPINGGSGFTPSIIPS